MIPIYVLLLAAVITTIIFLANLANATSCSVCEGALEEQWSGQVEAATEQILSDNGLMIDDGVVVPGIEVDGVMTAQPTTIQLSSDNTPAEVQSQIKAYFETGAPLTDFDTSTITGNFFADPTTTTQDFSTTLESPEKSFNAKPYGIAILSLTGLAGLLLLILKLIDCSGNAPEQTPIVASVFVCIMCVAMSVLGSVIIAEGEIVTEAFRQELEGTVTLTENEVISSSNLEVNIGHHTSTSQNDIFGSFTVEQSFTIDTPAQPALNAIDTSHLAKTDLLKYLSYAVLGVSGATFLCGIIYSICMKLKANHDGPNDIFYNDWFGRKEHGEVVDGIPGEVNENGMFVYMNGYKPEYVPVTEEAQRFKKQDPKAHYNQLTSVDSETQERNLAQRKHVQQHIKEHGDLTQFKPFVPDATDGATPRGEHGLVRRRLPASNNINGTEMIMVLGPILFVIFGFILYFMRTNRRKHSTKIRALSNVLVLRPQGTDYDAY